MNFEDKLSLFISQFNCAAKIAQSKGLIINPIAFRLKVSPEMKFYMYDTADINPVSYLLNGRNINKKIFGDIHYSKYYTRMCNAYCYMQLENQFQFNLNVIQKGFLEGFINEYNYYNRYDGEAAIAFDLGRHFLSKYVKVNLPYKHYPIFDLK